MVTGLADVGHSPAWPDFVKFCAGKHVKSNGYAGSSPRRAGFGRLEPVKEILALTSR
jgi:hypothetical protein